MARSHEVCPDAKNRRAWGGSTPPRRGRGCWSVPLFRKLSSTARADKPQLTRGERNLNPLESHLFELQRGHRSGRVLEQGLIYPNAHLLARLVVAGLNMVLEDLGDQVNGHFRSLRAFPSLQSYSHTMNSVRHSSPQASCNS